MKALTVDLSKQIKKSCYVSLAKQPKVDGVFYAGLEICLPDFAIDRDNFPFWILEYVASGHGEIILKGRKQTLQAGSIICYGPGSAIHFHNDAQNPFHKYFLCRTDETFPTAWKQAGLRPGHVLELMSSTPFPEVMEQLLRNGEQGADNVPGILSALELILLSYIRNHQTRMAPPASGSALVYQLAIDVMLKEFRDIHSLAQLSKRTGYGPEYLCRIFRKYHSESPYQTLQRMKMNEAFRLLKAGRLRIMDVALQVGYEDPLHFSRVFRKTMGFPPSLVNDQ